MSASHELGDLEAAPLPPCPRCGKPPQERATNVGAENEWHRIWCCNLGAGDRERDKAEKKWQDYCQNWSRA